MEKTRIIVVEDNRLESMGIKYFLEDKDFQVVSVLSTGKDAVREVLKQKPDLVLMDVKLRGKMDGIEAAEKINSKLNIPIIYLTAYSDEATVKRARLTKPIDFVLKPFLNVDLHSRIEKALLEHKKRLSNN